MNGAIKTHTGTHKPIPEVPAAGGKQRQRYFRVAACLIPVAADTDAAAWAAPRRTHYSSDVKRLLEHHYGAMYYVT